MCGVEDVEKEEDVVQNGSSKSQKRTVFEKEVKAINYMRTAAIYYIKNRIKCIHQLSVAKHVIDFW